MHRGEDLLNTFSVQYIAEYGKDTRSYENGRGALMKVVNLI